jgi:hypothetical protein
VNSARVRRSVTVLSMFAGVALSCALVWNATSAAFNGYTTNPNNSWTSGTLSLSDDDTTSALFNVSGLSPGDTGSRCIRVTYTGNSRADVRFYTTASTYTGTLGAYIDLAISEGPAGTYANGTCSDWTTGTSVYSGTMANFASGTTNFSTGAYNSSDKWSPVANGQYKVYKFTYTLQLTAPNSSQNTSGGIGFTWEAQSNPASDLALFKGATGSTACQASEAPDYAFDGSTTTKFCSTAGSPYLQVDLGSSQTIGGFALRHAGSNGESATLDTRDYTIQVSANGSAWSTVVTVANNAFDVTTHSVATSGRYVKVVVTAGTQAGAVNTRLYAFEIYGS